MSRTAKKAVSRWFCGQEKRRFLPLDDAAIPVSPAEASAIASASEVVVAQSLDRMNERVATGFLLMVGVPLLYPFFGVERFGDSVPAGVVMMASLVIGWLWLLLVAWRHERRLLDLREAIAFSLPKRSSGDAANETEPRESESSIRRTARLVFALCALLMLWPAAGAYWRQSSAAWIFDAAATVTIVVVMVLTSRIVLSVCLRRFPAAPEQ